MATLHRMELMIGLIGMYPKMIVTKIARFNGKTLVQCPYCNGWNIHGIKSEGTRVCDNHHCGQHYYIACNDIPNKSIKTHGFHFKRAKLCKKGGCFIGKQLKMCCKRLYDK